MTTLTINRLDTTLTCRQPNSTVVTMDIGVDTSAGLPCCDTTNMEYFDNATNSCL
eukprot:Awhi_evm1s9267